jgi:ferredoxin-NADP reductase
MQRFIMLELINDFLNKTTMYKVLMYGLFVLALEGIILSAFGFLSFNFLFISLTLIVFIFACYIINLAIGTLLGVTVNSESSIITALILFLIFQPASGWFDITAILLISLIAMASKYLLVANKIHIFNPAAFAALLSGIFLNYYATWWVGSIAMLPIVLIVGFLVIKKVRRFEMVGIFLLTAIVSACIFNYDQNYNLLQFIYQILTSWPIIFFATIMLTEPLTMPGTRNLQFAYAALVGILFGGRFNIGPIYSTPELALILGNLTFFVIKPRSKYILKLKEKIKLSPDIYEFIFEPHRKMNFRPGQYIEWTLGHDKPDTRGNRRFFTIASSPTENDVKIAIRVNEHGSSFKYSLQHLEPGQIITAAQVAGDFTVDTSKPAVLIAGGIGITPFRSNIKYFIDRNVKQDVNLFYFVKREEDIAFKDIFEEASHKLGLKHHYVVGDNSTDLEKMIKENVENYSKAKYYLSGPSAMVDNYKATINKMGIKEANIVTDYFPGF